MKKVNVKCPYCEFAENRADIPDDPFYTERQVITCDVDSGGCDSIFVAIVSLTPQTEIRKIEGEGEDS